MLRASSRVKLLDETEVDDAEDTEEDDEDEGRLNLSLSRILSMSDMVGILSSAGRVKP